nr:unnamed protein product [Digitaria exilis]
MAEACGDSYRQVALSRRSRGRHPGIARRNTYLAHLVGSTRISGHAADWFRLPARRSLGANSVRPYDSMESSGVRRYPGARQSYGANELQADVWTEATHKGRTKDLRAAEVSRDFLEAGRMIPKDERLDGGSRVYGRAEKSWRVIDGRAEWECAEPITPSGHQLSIPALAELLLVQPHFRECTTAEHVGRFDPRGAVPGPLGGCAGDPVTARRGAGTAVAALRECVCRVSDAKNGAETPNKRRLSLSLARSLPTLERKREGGKRETEAAFVPRFHHPLLRGRGSGGRGRRGAAAAGDMQRRRGQTWAGVGKTAQAAAAHAALFCFTLLLALKTPPSPPPPLRFDSI